MVAVVVSGGVKHEVMLYSSWDAVHQLSTLDRRTELCDMNINMDDLLFLAGDHLCSNVQYNSIQHFSMMLM